MIYTMKKPTLLQTIAFLFLLSCVSCGAKDDLIEEPPYEEPNEQPDELPEEQPQTTTTFKDAPYLIGCAVVPSLLQNNRMYAEVVQEEMSSITPENALKMGALSKGHGSYFWDDADYLVEYAADHQMRVHGHTLIWHTDIPGWVTRYSGTREEWIALMQEYIHEVVGRYQGRIASWDVVNEAFNDDGTYRKTIWYENIGEEYIRLAFEFAHEADPAAILFYNDYGMEYSAAKREAICTLVKDLRAEGVPVHGIGLQMHIDMYRSASDLKASIQAAADCGVWVHVSEMDVACNPEKKTDFTFTDKIAQQQKASYQAMSEALLSIPADQCFGITFWGVCDVHSWLTSAPDAPLPFDSNFEKKPAYDGLTGTFGK